MIIIRPFEENKDNAVELINETIFLALLTSFLHYHDQSRWNSKIELIYISAIMINSSIITLIYTFYAFKDCIMKIRNCVKSQNHVENFQPRESEPSTDQIVYINNRKVLVKSQNRHHLPEETKNDNISDMSHNHLQDFNLKKSRISG